MNETHNPDVLSCLANLSNDEVFTPPSVVNQMLDMLPQELFRSGKTTFLDIGCKSGVFLREITKRLITGLADEMPDLQTRVDHILHKQVFGIATTELTSLVSRRTLYCSKYPNCRYSASPFETVEGNIRFRNIPHTFVNGRCKWCGASEDQFGDAKRKGLETHAYEFIHTDHPEEIFKMKFDVIVGNPPYQLADGGAQASATPLYHLFVQRALKLHPRFLTMIIPSRWFAGGKGLDEFRQKMIHDTRVKVLHDFLNAEDCFGTGVEIKSGVCFFLWQGDYDGPCQIITHASDGGVSCGRRYLSYKGADVFIRRNEAISIMDKVGLAERNFSLLVSSRKPFGLATTDIGHAHQSAGDSVIYQRGGTAYYKRSKLSRNSAWVDMYKIFITKAYNAGDDFPHQILNKPIIAGKGTCCSETYVVIGPFSSRVEAVNVESYVKTRFFRFLVSLKKISQDATQKVYSFVPMQDFSKPWTDAELYAKYKLTKDEIAFIESMIKPME